jgi:hypothetical protein
MIEQRIDDFMDAFTAWIEAREGNIREAVDQTATRFHKGDVMHMLQHLRRRVTRESLAEWAARSYREVAPLDVLCLHAGNLPLVGFQDLAAVWLSGHRYLGKLSRKDPWLMASFLEVLSKRDKESRLAWSTELEQLPVCLAGHVLFAGSERTVPAIRELLLGEGRANGGTQWHIRTASFSVAWLEGADGQDYRDLAEAILRYDGSGCRSVKVVVSDVPLTSGSCGVTDTLEEWWSRQPSYRKPTVHTKYDVAVLHAVERPYLLLEHLLLETEGELNGNPDRILWLQGGQERVEALVGRYGAKIQSVYATGRVSKTNVAGRKLEALARAQDPPVDWRPDGEDILETLTGSSAE